MNKLSHEYGQIKLLPNKILQNKCQVPITLHENEECEVNVNDNFRIEILLIAYY